MLDIAMECVVHWRVVPSIGLVSVLANMTKYLVFAVGGRWDVMYMSIHICIYTRVFLCASSHE